MDNEGEQRPSFVKGVSVPSQNIEDPVVMDSLFKKAVGKVADDPSNLDTFLFSKKSKVETSAIGMFMH